MAHNRDNINLEIILLLLRGENHLRGIAKQLGQSHSTVSRRLNALLNDNVIDFRIEGKNKVFHILRNLQARNYVFNSERYKLMELIRKYPELGVIIDDILKRCSERLIILFGSHAKFTAKRNSDVDIYIETRSRKAKEDMELIHSNIRAKIGDFDTDSNLIKEIIKDHVILRGVEDYYEKIKFFK